MSYTAPAIRKGLELLIGKRELEVGDWYELLNIRRQMIRPFLDKFTLPELGSMEILPSSQGFNKIYGSPLITGDEGLSLKTQGIFYPQHGRTGGILSNGGKGIFCVWGISRSGEWILVKMNLIGDCYDFKHSFYNCRIESMRMIKSDVATIVDAAGGNTCFMLEQIDQSIKKMTDARKQLYEQSLELVRAIEAEEAVIGLITREHHSW